jgi:hypothetical protein
MIHDPELKAWIIQAIDESAKREYAYGEQKIDPREVLKKRDHFQLAKDRRASEEADAAKAQAIEDEIVKAA